MKLLDYLAQLNTADSTWGLYVNPDNYDDYRIGQLIFENGGLLDDKVFVDTLDNVSFGYQSVSDALDIILTSDFKYKGKSVKLNKEAIKELYYDNKLHKEFADYLDTTVNSITDEWAYVEAANFVEYELTNRLLIYEN